ncbi:MAG: hypothetical protein KQ78_02136 [Candidatus Izimaplasma bacterium HR2]|nr:MAG: hypothetical protein KQ78_02136 [Candidatus Izimaplasma bacterium HR2]
MSRFTDSPYFLLKDFMNALVVSSNSEYQQSDITNLHRSVVFEDIIFVGGVTHNETSTPFVDTLDRYPTFDTEADQAQIFTSDDVAWNGWWDRSPNASYFLDNVDINDDPASVAVMMRGGDSAGELVVGGGSYINLYAKKDDYGFVPIRLVPVYGEPAEKKYFKFSVAEISTLVPDDPADPTLIYDSDDIADEPYYDSDNVSIQVYDYDYDTSPIGWGDIDTNEVLENGTEIYFRKDSSFHDWLKEFAHDFYETDYEVDFIIRNYVNTDKMFIYFGEIYLTTKENISDPDTYHIVYNGLKDWVQAALPVNNRKDNLIEFLDTYFDQVYSEGYELLKNVWTLRDGWECDERFLGYVPTFYGVDKYDDIPDYFSDRFREYAAELVWLMKRKGTYASMYIIFELLCGNSNNIFNVLERWHDDTTGVISSDDYNDHIYTSLYGKETPTGLIGAGEFWYSKFDVADYPQGYLATGTTNDTDDKVLSPYYRVDLDLNVEPMTNFEILPKQISESLYYNWELMRPINRQTEYNLIYAPYTDLTGTEFGLYESPNSWQSITKTLDNVIFDPDNFIYIQRDSVETWSIAHTLLTMNVVITSYSDDFEKQIPVSIEVVDDSRVIIEWDAPTAGIVIISKASKAVDEYDPISWKIRHGLNRKEILFQVRTADNIVYYPEISYLGDNNTLYIENAPEADSEAFIKSGIAVGDSYDSDGDGIDDSTITQDIWVFDSVDIDESGDPKEITKYYYEDPETEIGIWWWAWVIDHPYQENVLQVNCYDVDNKLVEPAKVLLNETDPGGLPQLVILWADSDKVENDPNDYIGFAAIDNIGDVASFYGTIPKDEEGNLLDLEWRMTVEDDDNIYTFLQEGSVDADVLFVDSDKTINYYDIANPDNKTYVSGTVGLIEQDNEWYYYTFTVTNEALEQLNVKDYKIIAIELVNTRVKRFDKQRVVYSRLSGIYKPLGVNFIGHYRIFQNESGFPTALLDHDYIPLFDHNDENLYG